MRRRCKDETFQSLTTAKAPSEGVSRRLLVGISRGQHGNEEQGSIKEEDEAGDKKETETMTVSSECSVFPVHALQTRGRDSQLQESS